MYSLISFIFFNLSEFLDKRNIFKKISKFAQKIRNYLDNIKQELDFNFNGEFQSFQDLYDNFYGFNNTKFYIET